jgi:hypothetical protein
VINPHDILAEYLLPEEHELHSQLLNIAARFHVARLQAMTYRKAGDDEKADKLDAIAERLAKTIARALRLED